MCVSVCVVCVAAHFARTTCLAFVIVFGFSAFLAVARRAVALVARRRVCISSIVQHIGAHALCAMGTSALFSASMSASLLRFWAPRHLWPPRDRVTTTRLTSRNTAREDTRTRRDSRAVSVKSQNVSRSFLFWFDAKNYQNDMNLPAHAQITLKEQPLELPLVLAARRRVEHGER